MEDQYHKLFHTGKVPEVWTEEELMGYAVKAWELTHKGVDMPENFGNGMAAIELATGKPVTPKDLALYFKNKIDALFKVTSQYIWPQIFITGELPANWVPDSLIADALEGWALRYITDVPANFVTGMALIGHTLGIDDTSAKGIQAFHEKRKADKAAKLQFLSRNN